MAVNISSAVTTKVENYALAHLRAVTTLASRCVGLICITLTNIERQKKRMSTMDYIITIKPEWLAKILCGGKVMELQKRNLKPGLVGLAASGTSKLFGTARVSNVEKLNLAKLKKTKDKHKVNTDSKFFHDYMKTKHKGGGESTRDFLWGHHLEDIKRFTKPIDYTRKPGQVVKVTSIDEETQRNVRRARRSKRPSCNPTDMEEEIKSFAQKKRTPPTESRRRQSITTSPASSPSSSSSSRSSPSSSSSSASPPFAAKSAHHNHSLKASVLDEWTKRCDDHSSRKECKTDKDFCMSSGAKKCVPRMCKGRSQNSCESAPDYCIFTDGKCHTRHEHLDRPRPTVDDIESPDFKTCTSYYGAPSCKSNPNCIWKPSGCRPKNCKERNSKREDLSRELCMRAGPTCRWTHKSPRGRKLYCLDRPPVSRQPLSEKTCGYHALENLTRNLDAEPVFTPEQMARICSPNSEECTIPLMMYALSGQKEPYGLPKCVADMWANEKEALKAIKLIGEKYDRFKVSELSRKFIHERLRESLELRSTLGYILLEDVKIAPHYVAYVKTVDDNYLRIDSLPYRPRKIVSPKEIYDKLREDVEESKGACFGIIVERKYA